MKKKIVSWWNNIQWKKWIHIIAQIGVIYLLLPYPILIGMDIYSRITHKAVHLNLGIVHANSCWGDSCEEQRKEYCGDLGKK